MKTFKEFLSWETAQAQSVDYKPVYTDLARGDVVAGLLLSQIVWWCYIPSRTTNKTKLRVEKDGHLWLAKGRNDWYPELRIGPRQFDKAIKILVEEGIVVKKVYKFAGNPTIHVRILTDTFLEKLSYYTETNFDTTLQDEEEFRDEEDIFRGMAGDLGMEEADESASASLLAHVTGNSFSPNGENHNIDDSSSPSGKEESLRVPDEEKTPHRCPRCGSLRIVSKKIDEHRRCALCVLVDTWEHYVQVRGLQYRTKDGVRIYSTEVAKEIHKKMETRLKSAEFQVGWVHALRRAGQMKHLKSESWFNPRWFVTNPTNHQNITVEKKYDWAEKRFYPQAYAKLVQWDKQEQQRALQAREQASKAGKGRQA
jgi:hypothetical protein